MPDHARDKAGSGGPATGRAPSGAEQDPGFLLRQWRVWTSHMEPAVFIPAAAIIIVFSGLGIALPGHAGAAFDAAQRWITETFGWFYLLSATALLAVAGYLVLGRVGSVRFGGPDTKPDFPRLTWFTMMLSAGMGIGIVFFGIAEPIQHLATPPPGVEAQPESRDAAVAAMRHTFFHWGLHPWAIYAAIAIPLAYFHFGRGLPMAPRSMLYPLIGERIHGWPGHVVDTLCTVGTLFGVATSLGLGSAQINAGLERLVGLSQTSAAQVGIVIAITAVATVSVVSGVKVGIRRLSEGNIALMGVLLVFMFLAGPTVFQLDLFVSALGDYLQHLPELSLGSTPVADGLDSEAAQWQQTWTLFYWSWWISWSPFVGVFTARISKGRTVREFVLVALLVPTLVGFLWFAVVGGTGLEAVLAGEAADLPSRAAENEALSLYMLLDELPWSGVTAVLATLLIVVFFITSSDSGSLVDDMVTSGGDPNPPRVQRVFWALAEGATAIALLLAGGVASANAHGDGASGGQSALQALRSASLATGLPIAVLLLVGAYGLVRALRADVRARSRKPND